MAEYIVRQKSHVEQVGLSFSTVGEENLVDTDCWRCCERQYTFQPIYRTSGKLMGIELLTAVFYPSTPQQVISPEAYFKTLDVEKRLQVVIEQLQLLNQWNQRFIQDDLLASVNIDGLTLLALQKSRKAKKLITSMPWLRLELVESLEGLSKDTLANLPEARRLWLDDFGCGVANFSSLVLTKYDCIKIARELFVILLQTEEGRQLFPLLVTLISRYCNYVVIEGVETKDEWTVVKQSNATAAQGYYLARPQSFDHFDSLQLEL
ncbi:cyclic-guanylate-specific phosphodiesterase [Brenneria uluponensis]|uniref:cyclic-guanylate-specific phosphodiesterase n=1 Tax=Brenneria uluponensis TaxID=3057057 RepID=UPI0028EE92EF|nr:cyclic-guanylate-specific phosphodiesterase [Brenneria ulupoensis]